MALSCWVPLVSVLTKGRKAARGVALVFSGGTDVRSWMVGGVLIMRISVVFQRLLVAAVLVATSAMGAQAAKVCKFTPNSLRPLPLSTAPETPAPPTETSEPATGPSQPGTPAEPPPKPTFAYYPPGVLHNNDPREGRVADRRVYLPDIIFPLKLGPGLHPHMNSQIYGYGGGGYGGKGEAGGSECDPRNYDPFTQRDDYCEIRGWNMPMCPSGTGHQGQDIRPPTCTDSKWEAVAVVDGTITGVTSNTTVKLKGGDGTDYWYLHMNPRTITVKAGDKVKQGAVLGKVSNFMNGKRATTKHLHFQVRQTLQVDGRTISTWIPLYASLVNAYRKSKGVGAAITPDGRLAVDPRYEIGVEGVDQPPPSPESIPLPERKPSGPVVVIPPTGPAQPETPGSQEPPAPQQPEPQQPAPQQPEPQKPPSDQAETPPPTPPVAGGGDVKTLDEARTVIARLEGELAQLKVTSQREAETLKGVAEEARGKLADNQKQLDAASARVAALEGELATKVREAKEQQEVLQLELEAAKLKVRELTAALDEKTKPSDGGVWTGVKDWWQSFWKKDN